MKKTLIIFLVFWLYNQCNLPAQAQVLEYALLENNELIVPYRDRSDESLKTYTLANPKVTKIDRFFILLNSFFPFVWDYSKHNETICAISCNAGPIRAGSTSIDRQPKEHLDSLAAQQKLKRFLDSLTQVFPDSNALERAYMDWQMNYRHQHHTTVHIPQIREWFLSYTSSPYYELRENRNIYKTIAFDFKIWEKDNYDLYVRTPLGFSIWTANISQMQRSYEPSVIPVWKEIASYDFDSIQLFKPNGNYAHLPKFDMQLHCAITDSSFLQGHFKIIYQGVYKWSINTLNGGIYYLGNGAIVKVAQIEQITNYPKWIQNKAVFIEDRDRGELIFFSKITQLDRQLPLPKYRSLITPREVTQRFGALATLPKTNNRK